MKKLKRRKAETLMEVLTAIAIFGIIIEGFSDFMANQTIALARTKDRETIMYYAQKWISSGDYAIDEADGGRINFVSNDGVLTVTLNRSGAESSMQFRLK